MTEAKEEMNIYRVEDNLIKMIRSKKAASTLAPLIVQLLQYISTEEKEIEEEDRYIYYNVLLVARSIASRANTHRLKTREALEELRFLCEAVSNSEKYQQMSIK